MTGTFCLSFFFVYVILRKNKNGCDNVAKTVAESAKVIAGLKTQKKQQSAKDTEKKKYICTCCGEEYLKQSGNFPQSRSELFKANGYYYPVCRQCCIKYFEEYLTLFEGDSDRAIDRMCQILDIYFDPVLLEQTNIETFGDYISKTNLRQYQKRGVVYYDTILDRKKLGINGDPFANKTEVPIEWRKYFGEGYTENEYWSMIEDYQDYMERYECKDKAQEELFLLLVIQKTLIRRAVARNEDADKLMKTFQELLGSANLKPSQNRRDSFTDNQTTFSLLKKFEETRPVPDPDPEFVDVDGISRLWNIYFVGHLMKMLGQRDSYIEQMYEEEMKRYSVDREELQNKIDEEDNFDIPGVDL
jgi:hypothetical protein